MKKIIFFIGTLVVFSLFLNASPAKAMTAIEIQALIAQLQQQIAELQKQLVETPEFSVAWCHDFNVNLGIGSQGSEVLELKTALIKDGIWPNEAVNDELDEETASYIVEFQEKYKSETLTPVRLKRGNGYVGKLTRAKLNNLFGCVLTAAPVVPQIVMSAPSVTLFSPNGGERWLEGNTYYISWNANNVEKVNIEADSGGKDLGLIISAAKASDGKFPWKIPFGFVSNFGIAQGNLVKIEISDVKDSLVADRSDNFFTIVEATTTPFISEITPNQAPQDTDIFNAEIKGSNFKGAASLSGCGISPVSDRGFNLLSCKVVSDTEIQASFSASAAAALGAREITLQTLTGGKSNKVIFTITAAVPKPIVQVVSPNSGEQWLEGEARMIIWKVENFTEALKKDSSLLIDLLAYDEANNKINPKLEYRYGAPLLKEPIYRLAFTELNGKEVTSLGSDKFSWNWVIQADLSSHFEKKPASYKIKVETQAYPSNKNTFSDQSDGYFIIKSDTLAAQTCNSLKSSGSGEYYFNLCKTYGYDKACFNKNTSVYQGCGKSAVNDCTLNNANASQNVWCDISPVPTVSTLPFVTVLSPNGGEKWTAGKTYNITWLVNNLKTPSVLIIPVDYQNSNALCYERSYEVSAYAGKYSWTIPEKSFCQSEWSGGKYKILIEETEEAGINAVQDYSDNYFSIAAAPMACTDTDGGINYSQKGTTQGWAAGDVMTTDTDYCSSAINLVEWYCLPEFNGLKNTYRTNNNYACPNGCNYVDGACFATPTVGSLSLSLSPNLPYGEQVPGLNKEVFRFTVSADVENIRLSKVSVNFASQNGADMQYEIGAINLYNSSDLSTILGTAYLFDNVATFNFPSGLGPVLPNLSTNTFVLRADTTQANSATPVKFSVISPIEGVGVASAKNISSMGSAEGGWLTFPAVSSSSSYSGNLTLNSGWNYFSIPVKEGLDVQKIKDCAPGTWVYGFVVDGSYYNVVQSGMLSAGEGYAAILGSGATSCSIPISGAPYNIKDAGIAVRVNTTNALIGASSVVQTIDEVIGTCDKNLLTIKDGLSQATVTSFVPTKSYWLKYTGAANCKLGNPVVVVKKEDDQLASISEAIIKLMTEVKKLLGR